MFIKSKADEPSIVATLRGRVAVLTEMLNAALDVASSANAECDDLREQHERDVAELKARKRESISRRTDE